MTVLAERRIAELIAELALARGRLAHVLDDDASAREFGEAAARRDMAALRERLIDFSPYTAASVMLNWNEVMELSDPVFIAHLYDVLLDRHPDDLGLATHVAKLAQGGSRTYLVENMLLSEEFSRKNAEGRKVPRFEVRESNSLSDQSFVIYVYRTILGRRVNNHEFDTHLMELRSGATRRDVIKRITEGDEFRHSGRSLDTQFDV